MADGAWRVRALLMMGVSGLALLAGTHGALAQNAMVLDAITVTATKTEERAIDALAPVTTVTSDEVRRTQANRLSDVFFGKPGISFQDRGDDPATAFNIRGLQDFGRVAVLIDGARQNFQQSGHNANGYVYFEPELLSSADVVRGPTSNIYGSGAIGGVVSLRTKDLQDVVRPGENWGVAANTSFKTNGVGMLGSLFAGARVNPNIDMFAGVTYRDQANYRNGNNVEIQNTGNDVSSAIAKVTLRPADGHEIKVGGIFYDARFDTGQPMSSYTNATSRQFSIYNSDVLNYTANARWRYSKPDDRIFNWDVNVYWNRTDSQQVKVAHSTTNIAIPPNPSQGNNITGFVGDRRGFKLDTIGFDANNTSRVDFGEWRHAFTYGADAFNDKVSSFDPRGSADITTPSGQRTVSGGFLQWKAQYSTWLEVVSAARYDNYSFSGGGVNNSGDRISPKTTVGVTPVKGFTPYVSYAEGYRAPALTETIINGAHPAGSPFSVAFTCPDGSGGFFCFLPNPNLRPEVGKNKEIGINLKYDNIFQAGDAFRGKINLFRNDLSDYIELTSFGPCSANPAYGCAFRNWMQYQNVPKARIDGFEFETHYDAGLWFAGVSGQWLKGENLSAGTPLASVPANRITTTLGVRSPDRKFLASIKWSAVQARTDVPTAYFPTNSYDLVNFYMGYQPTEDVLVSFGIDNLLDKFYLPYAVLRGDPTAGGGGNSDQLFAGSGPGRVFKGSLRIRFGAT
jgi:hemoglobin/transferrin/lactoferrin receptor protein